MNEHYQLSALLQIGKKQATKVETASTCFYKIVVLMRTGKKEKKPNTKVLVISHKFEMFSTHMDSCRCTSPDGSEFCDLASASFTVGTGCSYVSLVFPHKRTGTHPHVLVKVKSV